MDTKCVVVFTAESPDRILRQGGSKAWVLDPVRARKVPFLICAQNQNNPDRDFSDTSEPHGAAFLIGRISDVIPAQRKDGGPGWQIRISEFCRHTVLDAWKGWQNPVRYTTLEEMGIKLADLHFEPAGDIQQGEPVIPPSSVRAAHDGAAPISIATAKIGLAAFYGVAPEAVEIVIRG